MDIGGGCVANSVEISVVMIFPQERFLVYMSYYTQPLRLFQKNNYPSPAPPRIQGGAIMRTSKFSPRIRGELEGGKIKPVSFSTKASGIVKYLEKP